MDHEQYERVDDDNVSTPRASLESQQDDDLLNDLPEASLGEKESKSTLYLIALTVAIAGLQVAWCVELAGITPFLLQLGISKSLLALIWLAAPAGGVLVQPYVGIRSDNCRSRFGRRRPFIIGGALITSVSLITLAWTRTIVGSFFSIFGADRNSDVVVFGNQVFGILLVCILDFAINVIQAGIRALVVDCAPTHQQEDANAWASKLTGVGNIFGYLLGFVDLPQVMPWLGNTQFRVLCAIACIAMTGTAILSCASVHEVDGRTLPAVSNQDSAGVVSFFRTLWNSTRNLPLQIRRVCQVQLFAWMAWFPFLFYTSQYVAEIYADPLFAANPNMTASEIDQVLADGARLGSDALFVYAIVTFSASIILPWIIVPTHLPVQMSKAEQNSYAQSSAKPSIFTRISRLFSLSHLRIPNLTLRRAWLISHLLFAIAMWCTFLVHNVTAVMILIGAVGVPWAMTNWAPYALIANEISQREARREAMRTVGPLANAEGIDSSTESGLADRSAGMDQAGVLLGIHNVSIAAPQIVATLVSSAIFKALQKPRGQAGDDSIAWTLRFAGVCALGAAWLTQYVAEGSNRPAASATETRSQTAVAGEREEMSHSPERERLHSSTRAAEEG